MPDNSRESKTIDPLLEQYKLYVEMADRVSARRAETNKIYASLMTALMAVIPLSLGANTTVPMLRALFAGVSLLGIILCLVWILNIRSYKQLNALKFTVIHEMELMLPFPCFDREWQILHQQDHNQEYLPLSHVERYVPTLLVVPYIVMLVLVIVWG